MYKEFTFSINLDELTPKALIHALNQIPSDYMDDYLRLTVENDEPQQLSINMVIDDAEEARAKWRRGDPDYVLFLDLL